MRILVVGSGGREHALCWKISTSKRVKDIYCAPGNGGTSAVATNIDIQANDIEGLLAFALEKEIDLTIVGPEEPLRLGIVDEFIKNGLRIFGANKKSAQLEASKEYCKQFMNNYNIPTAKWNSFTEYDEAIEGLKEYTYPLVIKADGLCGGKGVVICESEEEAHNCLKDILQNKIFGEEGNKIIIEEFLDGFETSLLCFVTEGRVIPMDTARDYKKALEGDLGPNTGGIGCFSPSSILTKELNRKIERSILNNIRFGLSNDEMDFKGVLYIGLMIVDDEPIVLEFNVRLGDPEAQVLIPRLSGDIIDVFQKTIDGVLNKTDLVWDEDYCVTVIAHSEGYPGNFEKGFEISGLENLDDSIILFHNSTKVVDNKLITNGGRVFSVTSMGETLEEARNNIYSNIDKIKFKGISYRKDIALKD
ncbi:MAG: phosphoribosylamine--glycine ligase [Tissierellia bacterium]|jgi:phosphoribosylamine--glycine ligase|nr:phosphoribosylamine--glycine ligase [Tissierellia bacterium]